jgi:ABC-2 type transport system permease protein
MLNLSRLKELTLFDFYYSLANLKSLAFIIPYFFFWYLIFDNVSQLAAEWVQSTQGLFFVSYLLQNQEMVTRLFVDRPATLSIYLLISTTITPLFILLAANNQYSSDAARGAFRFILTRATRTELYLSRFIAVTLLVSICLCITSLWASTQAYLNNEEQFHAIMLYGLQTFTLLFFYSLPFIAFMSTVSTLTRTAFGCLFFGMMAYILILTVSFLFKNDFSYLSYFIPSGIKATLIDVNVENIFISIAALSLYTLVYFSFGCFIFKRKDM